VAAKEALVDNSSNTRREFVKKAAYVAPAILTLAAAPAFAKSGSEKGDKHGGDDDRHKKHRPKHPGS
jgi:hypothetical protein